MLQALGGILVALVMRYADSVLKGFATSISIIISSLASNLLFSSPLSTLFLWGASLVMVSVFLYSTNPTISNQYLSHLYYSPIQDSRDSDIEEEVPLIQNEEEGNNEEEVDIESQSHHQTLSRVGDKQNNQSSNKNMISSQVEEQKEN